MSCTAAAWFTVCLGSAVDAAESAAESSVKAAFLYKFPAYIERPDRPDASAGPVEIGVVSDEAVRAALEEIAAGRTPDERGIRVRRVENVAAVEGLHVLFIGDAASAAASKQYLDVAHAESVLTVTEHDAARHDSVIRFVLVNGRVRFTISLAAAQRANLRISSRLLAVAEDVRKGAVE